MNIITSILLVVFTFFASILNGTVSVGSPKAPKDDFIPVMRFMATSDVHIKTFGDTACRRLSKSIQSAYAIAQNDLDYKDLDAVAFTGDITDRGTKDQYLSFASITKTNLQGDTKLLAVCAKSHDCNVMGRDALKYFSDVTGLPKDYHYVIKGFHFIGISASSDPSVHYDDEQIKWLDEQLQQAVRDDPLKPVFVFQHEHILNTVYGSYPEDGWGMEYLDNVLYKYPQVIDISGHSHYPANDPRAVAQKTFTAINDGGMAYFEFTVDGENCVHPDNYRSMAQVLIVEADKNNNVLVRVYDVTAKKFVYQYYIDSLNIVSPVKVKYNHSVLKSAAKAPVFKSGSEITAKHFGKSYKFTIPQAEPQNEDNNHEDIVFTYKIKVSDEQGETVAAQTQLSQYYFADVPETITFDSIKLESGKYTVQVTALDAWEAESEPLTLQIEV